MSVDVHVINADAAKRRAAGPVPTLRAGQVLWMVPIRWWEPEDYAPVRVVVQKRDDGWLQWDPQRPEVFGLYVHSDEYGHLVYLRGVDCYPTEDEAKAEMARRTEVMEAEYQAWADRLVEKVIEQMEGE